MDLSQPVLVVGVADQCIAVLRDRFYYALVVIDVFALSEADFYKSLAADDADKIRIFIRVICG